MSQKMTLLDQLVVHLAFILIDYSCGHRAGFSMETLGHYVQHKVSVSDIAEARRVEALFCLFPVRR